MERDNDGAPARGRRPPHGAPVVDRALSLLAAFDGEHRRLRIGELARRTGMPTSSALRLASRLLDWGALERGPDGRFCVGLRLLEVASLAPRGYGLREIALPYLTDLAMVTRQHVLLGVRDGLRATLVERLSGHAATPVQYRVGGHVPLHSTGIGLALLGFAPAEVQEELLAAPVHREPDDVLIPPAVLRRTLAAVRRERLAVLRRYETEPLVSVAAPIYGQADEVVAAISVLLPERGAQPRRLGLAVQTAAQGISRELGAGRAFGA